MAQQRLRVETAEGDVPSPLLASRAADGQAFTEHVPHRAEKRSLRTANPLVASAIAWMPLPVVFVARVVRAAVLLVVVAFIRLTEPLFRKRYPRFGPRILRRQLESAGGGFAKIGQLLAHRSDVLPERYCTELASILDDLPGVPASLIINRIQRDLAIASLARVYSEFDDRPISAASIAQVHRARLLNGTAVVVKVMRPGIEKRFRADLAIAGLVARAMNLFRAYRRMGIRSLAAEFTQLTAEELDFTREVRNFRQLRERMLTDTIDHYCPEVFPDCCAPTVITMEDIRGVSVKELMQTVAIARGAVENGSRHSERERSAALDQLQRWADEGIRPERTARLMVRSFLEQAMRHRLFHADPHAANMIVMKGGTLAWIDLGMIGWLDERLWAHEFKMREAIGEGRLDEAYVQLLATMEPLPDRDLSQFEAEFKRILRDWLAEVEQPSGSGSAASVARRSNFHLFTQTLSAVRRAGLRLPAPLVRLYRTIIIGDMVVLRLDSTVNWQSLIRDFVADERLRRTVELCERGASPGAARALIELAVDGPALLLATMKRAAEPASTPRSQVLRTTHADRAARKVLGQIKLAVIVATVVLFTAPLLPSRWIPSAMAPGVDGVRPLMWWVLVGGILAAWVVGQVEDEFED